MAALTFWRPLTCGVRPEVVRLTPQETRLLADEPHSLPHVQLAPSWVHLGRIAPELTSSQRLAVPHMLSSKPTPTPSRVGCTSHLNVDEMSYPHPYTWPPSSNPPRPLFRNDQGNMEANGDEVADAPAKMAGARGSPPVLRPLNVYWR